MRLTRHDVKGIVLRLVTNNVDVRLLHKLFYKCVYFTIQQRKPISIEGEIASSVFFWASALKFKVSFAAIKCWPIFVEMFLTLNICSHTQAKQNSDSILCISQAESLAFQKSFQETSATFASSTPLNTVSIAVCGIAVLNNFPSIYWSNCRKRTKSDAITRETVQDDQVAKV